VALVQHNNLPSIERMRLEGVEVCSPDQADDSLPVIKVGFLNMMPDTALAATERQFLRLLAANPGVNCYFYPFDITGVERSEQARLHIDQYYCDFDALKSINIDALVVTGANVSQPLLQDELFWPELIKVLDWARSHVRSTICSCLATHAAAKVFYDVDRKSLGEKCWGVFAHNELQTEHPLMKNVQGNIMMCHSRFNDVSKKEFVDQNIEVLIHSEQVGVQLACEKNISVIYFQGHPEYDDISLLKEYKREIIRYLAGQREDYPPVPQNYFNQSALDVIEQYKQLVQAVVRREDLLDSFPEEKLNQALDNPWKKSAQTIFFNWLQFLAS
jgi:homoserine O-succinyltransferase